jgi:hypothetical protein
MLMLHEIGFLQPDQDERIRSSNLAGEEFQRSGWQIPETDPPRPTVSTTMAFSYASISMGIFAPSVAKHNASRLDKAKGFLTRIS